MATVYDMVSYGLSVVLVGGHNDKALDGEFQPVFLTEVAFLFHPLPVGILLVIPFYRLNEVLV